MRPARITWALRIVPEALDNAFWRARARQLHTADLSLALFHIAVGAAVIWRMPQHEGMSRGRCALVFAPELITDVVWVLAMFRAAFYLRNRTVLAGAVRMLQGYFAFQTTNSTTHMIWTTVVYEWPLATHLSKTVLTCNPVQMLIEATATRLPFSLQVTAVLFKSALLLLGDHARAYIRFANSRPGYHTAAHASAFTWGALVQPTMPLLAAPAHPRLCGRSSEIFLSLAVLYMTTSAVLCYLIWVVTWLDMVTWARSLLKLSAAAGGGGGGGTVLLVEGTAVPTEQLEDLVSTPGASRLLRATASSLILHCITLLVVCQAAHVASQWLVLWVVPHVVSERLLDEFYPSA